MVTQQLLDYIKMQIGAGVSNETIQANLINSGWSQIDIMTAMAQLAGSSGQPVTPPETDNHQLDNVTEAQKAWAVKNGNQELPTKANIKQSALNTPVKPDFTPAASGQPVQPAQPVQPQQPQPQPIYQGPLPQKKNNTCLIVALVGGGCGCLILIIIILATGMLVAINPAGLMNQARSTLNRNNYVEIQNALERYKANKNEYPNSLDDLVSDGDLSTLPTDPDTKLTYRYEKLENNDYQLCTPTGASKLVCASKISSPSDLFGSSEPTPTE